MLSSASPRISAAIPKETSFVIETSHALTIVSGPNADIEGESLYPPR